MPEKRTSPMYVDETYRERAIARSMEQVEPQGDTQHGGLPSVAVTETVVLDTSQIAQFDFQPEDN